MSSVATTNRGADLASPQASIQTLNVRKDQLIQAPLQIVWESLLEEMGPEGELPDGTKYPRVLEAWPGGRWYRDLGNNAGHFWGHVQVIKPPTLLEICGPMFMSYPATSHVQYRLTTEGKGTKLSLVHQAIGLLDPKHMEGVNKGWEYINDHVRRIAERKAGK